MEDNARKRGRPPKGSPRQYPVRIVVELDERGYRLMEGAADKEYRSVRQHVQSLVDGLIDNLETEK